MASIDGDLEWDLLRTFEAIARRGSLTGAGEALGMSQSTVSRHLARLEDLAGSPLVLRSAPIRLTDRGEALRAAVQPMLDGALAATAALTDSPAVEGVVTVSTVAEMLRWVLVDGLPDFYRRCPRLRLRILADNHNASLAAGEADIALRFARPTSGALVARRLARLSYGVFGPPDTEPAPDGPWLGLTGSLARIPEQAMAERVFGHRPPRLLVEDIEALGRAVAVGLGVAILPRGLAERLGLREVDPTSLGIELPRVPDRALWLVMHPSRRDLPRVRAVADWVVQLFDGRGV